MQSSQCRLWHPLRRRSRRGESRQRREDRRIFVDAVIGGQPRPAIRYMSLPFAHMGTPLSPSATSHYPFPYFI
jgi:hypothetical protein